MERDGTEDLEEERLAWAERAFELAGWTILRLVGRDDAFGAYGKKPYTAKRWLGPKVVMRHFLARGRGDVIGLHCVRPDNACKWMAWDLDDHGGDPAAPARNMGAALSLCRDLAARGFEPLLESSGKGLHVWLLLRRAVPSRRAFLFARPCSCGTRSWPGSTATA